MGGNPTYRFLLLAYLPLEEESILPGRGTQPVELGTGYLLQDIWLVLGQLSVTSNSGKKAIKAKKKQIKFVVQLLVRRGLSITAMVTQEMHLITPAHTVHVSHLLKRPTLGLRD